MLTRWFTIFVLLCCVRPGLAAELNTDTAEIDTDETYCSDLFPEGEEDVPDKAFFSFLDGTHDTISGSLKDFTRGADAFFSNENAKYESSRSYLRFRGDLIWNEGGDFSTQGDLKIKIRLPQTEKKLKVVFESNPNERLDDLERIHDQPIDRTEDKDNKYYAGIEADLGRKDKWRFKPSLSIKLRSPLEYLIRFRGNRTYRITNKWRLDFTETLYWFNTTGFGADTNIDFRRPFYDNFLFRSNTFFRYTDLNDYWDLSQVFAIDHRLSDRRAISYQVGAFGISEPSIHSTDYLLSVRYRQNIHSDYLFAEVIPQILYQKINDFHAEHSVLFRIEIIFND